MKMLADASSNINLTLADDSSEWYIDLKNGSGSVGQGAPSTPADVTFTLKSANFHKVKEIILI